MVSSLAVAVVVVVLKVGGVAKLRGEGGRGRAVELIESKTLPKNRASTLSRSIRLTSSVSPSW